MCNKIRHHVISLTEHAVGLHEVLQEAKANICVQEVKAGD